MRTLYVSDLDGTLLRSDETLSGYTKEVINRLVSEGMLFSYATARSFVTSSKVASGIETRTPVIVYNGSFIVDGVTSEVLVENSFDDGVYDLLDELFSHEIYPIVYAYIDGAERFSYIPEKCSDGMKRFLSRRANDRRERTVGSFAELTVGKIFYISCIDTPKKLRPMFDKYKDIYHCLYQKETYTGDQWFEAMPQGVSKANAVVQLKKLLNCDRLVVFGDGLNDVEMFGAANEAYAVESAVDEIKKIATGVIGGCDDDGVARWLAENFGGQRLT